MQDHYDLIIIGAGIAAQSVLRGLAPNFRGRICVIEVGELRKSKVRFRTRNSAISVSNRRVRAFGLGGTSLIWGGNLIPFTRLEIEQGGWGLSGNEMTAFLPQALDLLGFQSHADAIVDDWQQYLSSAGSTEFATRAQYRQASQKDRLLEPQRTGVKFDLETGLFAEKLIPTADGWQVVSTGHTGNEHRIVGRKVVIANGNLESLRLMHKSGLSQSEAFGRYWSGHLQLVVGTFSTRDSNPLNTEVLGKIIRQEFFHLPCSGVPGHSAWKVQLFSVRRSLLSLLELGPFYSLVVLFRLIVNLLVGRETYFVNFDGDQIPARDSRVIFSKHGTMEVRHCAGKEDVQSLSVAVNILKTKVLGGDFSPFSSNPKRLLSLSRTSSHHLGGARIARAPREGVVDENLEVFGSPGVYVCSTSVFKSFSAANPSLMLCQLGLRLGKHLSKQQS